MRAGAAALVLLPLLAGCFGEDAAPVGVACDADAPAQDPAWVAAKPRVRIETTLGSFVAALEREKAPRTVENFLSLAASGVYDGTAFHRVIAGFVIQGGDPNTLDADPKNDGHGGPGYAIDDEFNPTLRHDAEGVLSMATAGPDTGGSQFFVTLGPQPQLDDRHSVFGRVVHGIEVVRALGRVPVDEDDRPLADVRILRVTEEGEANVTAPAAGVRVLPVLKGKVAEPGRPVTFAVVLPNDGDARAAVGLRVDAPQGWACRVSEAPVVPARTGRVAFVTLTPEGDFGVRNVTLTAVAGAERATASVRVTQGTFGDAVREGDRVLANYAGLLPDGRLFDTSMPGVGNDEALPKFVTPGGWQAKASYAAFPFTVGRGVIPGFTELALTAREGETVTAPIDASKAYTSGSMYERPLTGRDLVFELEIVRIE